MDDVESLRRESVLLTDGSIGVSTEPNIRKITPNGGSLYTSVRPEWLDALNICEAGAETCHSLSTGKRPVIIQHPAIIVQPAAVLREAGILDDGEGGGGWL